GHFVSWPVPVPIFFTSSDSSIRSSHGLYRLGARVVERPERVEGREVEQLADAVGSARQHHLAAVLLYKHMTFYQERDEHRAEELDLAEVDDQPGRRVLAQGREHNLRGLLNQVFRHALDLGSGR